MKRPVLIIAAVLLSVTFACNKHRELPSPTPERELSVPEKVEKELTDVLAKDWKSLADTLHYFDSTMLSKGKFKGTGPDGVYYELDIRTRPSLKASFEVEDSTFIAMEGKIRPMELKMTVIGTEIGIKKEVSDSVSLSVSKIKVTAPETFLSSTEHKASLFYENRHVGYLTREEFENTDYSTGTYIVIHYYNDHRTFAIYDNGLASLLKMSLTDDIK